MIGTGIALGTLLAACGAEQGTQGERMLAAPNQPMLTNGQEKGKALEQKQGKAIEQKQGKAQEMPVGKVQQQQQQSKPQEKPVGKEQIAGKAPEQKQIVGKAPEQK